MGNQILRSPQKGVGISFWEYWGRVLWLAIPHSVGLSQIIVGVLAAIVSAIGYFFPLFTWIAQQLGATVDLMGWRPAFISFGAVAVVRLVRAPWQLHRQLQAELASKELEKANLEISAPYTYVHLVHPPERSDANKTSLACTWFG